MVWPHSSKYLSICCWFEAMLGEKWPEDLGEMEWKLLINFCFIIYLQYGFVGRWFSPSRPTVGALDFGGASTQITFETQDKIEEDADVIRLRLYGYEYSVYTHSFLCYGQGQILTRLLAHLIKVTPIHIYNIYNNNKIYNNNNTTTTKTLSLSLLSSLLNL